MSVTFFRRYDGKTRCIDACPLIARDNVAAQAGSSNVIVLQLYPISRASRKRESRLTDDWTSHGRVWRLPTALAAIAEHDEFHRYDGGRDDRFEMEQYELMRGVSIE
jgi:hypothetical protein